jgi:iron complex outermembrane receptor protein
METRYGRVGLSAGVDRLLKNDYQTASATPPVALLANFGEPSRWKGRASTSWGRGGFSASATLNYVSGYGNTLYTPQQKVDAWTTGDLYFGYKTSAAAPFYLLRNLTVAFTINNVTDERPPYASLPPADLQPGQPDIPFDAANASPLGRVMALQLSKHW